MNPVPTELIPSTEELRATYDGPDDMLGRDVVTLMMRHLPRTYTLQELADEIEAVVPSCAYNYIHLPWDHRRGSNITYVFVNFTCPEWAMRTFLLLSGRSWTFVQCPKVCRVAAAFLQGLGPNLANYAINCGIEAESSKAPAVFTCDHQRMDLQLAVNTFCTPGDFQMARKQALQTQGGAAATATSMKVSGEATDVDFKPTNEMLTKNVDTKQSCKMLMKDWKNDKEPPMAAITAHHLLTAVPIRKVNCSRTSRSCEHARLRIYRPQPLALQTRDCAIRSLTQRARVRTQPSQATRRVKISIQEGFF